MLRTLSSIEQALVATTAAPVMSNAIPFGNSSAIVSAAPPSSASGARSPRNVSVPAMIACASASVPGCASAFHPASRNASSASGSGSPRSRWTGSIAWKHEKRACAASGYMSGASFSNIAASGASPAACRCAAALSSHADCARSIWVKVGTRS